MMYSKIDMYNMLLDNIGIPEEYLDAMLKLIGDVPQSYVKILNACSEYSTFSEVEDAMFSDEYV